MIKTGRNDMCPCGSGKKYKKCCIDKSICKVTNVNTVPIENSESDFDYIETVAEQIEQIISIYKTKDVIRAVFCINAWANNRSAMAQTLTLNQAICITKRYGNQNIKDYTEFKTFFDAVALYLPITDREDLTLNDFGKVKIIVDGETYPIILGTGHEQVYAVMNFLPVLANVIQNTDDLKAVLRYSRKIISTISDRNVASDDGNYNITFELPTEQFWQAVNDLFNSEEFSEHIKSVFQIMGYQKCPIEMRHFFLYKGNYYPLYNTSILVDLYKKFLSLATAKEYQQHINLTLGGLIENAFNFSDSGHSRVLIAPKIININTDKPYTDNHLSFMTARKNKVLIAINIGDFDNIDSVNAEIQIIKSLHEKNQLRLVETYYRKEIHGAYASDILTDMSIQFLLIEPFTDITAHGAFLGTDGEKFSCSALDLYYMIGFSEDFDELLDFIEYETVENAKILAFGGKSNLFFIWKNANHHISSGAIEFSLITVQYGTADDYVFKHYEKNLVNYPFGIQSRMFANPLCWKVKEGDFGYSHFERKGCWGFGGEGKMIGPSTFLFLAHNVEFFTEEDFTTNNYTALRTIDELNQRLFNKYGQILSAFPFFSSKVIQIMFMPMHYAKNVDHSGFTSDNNKKYVYSDIFIDQEGIIIRYAVNLDDLLSAILNATDRSIESIYFLELIKPLKKYLQSSFVRLEEIVNRDSALKKEVSVFNIEQEYYYSDMVPIFRMEAQNFVKARKEIAKVCFATGVQPGEYHGQEATLSIREIQTAIVKTFENQISKYNKDNLHKKALNYYATQLHGTIINLKRYLSFKDLEPHIQQEFEEKTRNMREECRQHLRTAQYLLESNLAIQHQNTISDCEKDEFENLLAFADWLVVLQDNADTCYYADYVVSIEIDSEFKVNTVLSKLSELQYQDILKRKYGHEDYTIKEDETDKKYLHQCMNAFLIDTGIEFDTLISLLEYMQLEAINESFIKEVYPNVFEASKDDLIKGFITVLINPKEYDLTMAENALRFITLECDKLKSLNGVIHDVLPIWDREKRDNRFDVRPIVMQEDKCIFSPIVMNQLATMWKSGLIEWHLPFEIGLENVKIELAKWKRRYEDEMVQDIAGALIEKGFYPVLPEIEFASRYPKSEFPGDLGDYDVIAVNKTKKEIWLIESKFLQKVGSIYEHYMQQKNFFYQNTYDEKFQKRIDYIKFNLNKVTSVLGLETTGYTVIPYMVTNKLFASRYKKISFPIVTYNELMRVLEDY